MAKSKKYILWFKEIRKKDVPLVGGKGASLGEMMSQLKGVPVPDGFCVTTHAYKHFLEDTGMDKYIKEVLSDLDTHDVRNLQARGKKILTIEGLNQGDDLHPLQRAFVDKGAVQCGFCTPGLILAAKALLDRHPHPTREQVREAVGGHLCRCTGYETIFEAIESVASKGPRGL